MATQAMAAQAITGIGRVTEWIASPQRALDPAEHNALLMEAQRRGRRGPTPEALFAKRIDNSRLVKAADPARGREMRSFACAMAFLLSLALAYGWQHFSAIEYGYKLEAQKQQLQQLEEQNRELRLTQAQLADPARIDTLARSWGLTAPHPGQVVRPNASMDAGTNGAVMAEVVPYSGSAVPGSTPVAH